MLRSITLGLVGAFFTIYACYSSAQERSNFQAERVKTAFVYNFIKHIYWPNEIASKPFTIAVYKDRAFYSALQSSLSNQRVRNRNISVRYVEEAGQLPAFDIVYISKTFLPDLNRIASETRTTKTLLISEFSSDKKDVMINFIMDQAKNTLSFEVNKSNIVYEELNMSDELLLLGGTELDVAKLYRETELALLNFKKNEGALKASVQELKSSVSSYEKQLQDKTADLNSLKSSVANLQQAFQKKERELDELYNKMSDARLEVENYQEKLSEQQQSFALKSEQLAEMEEVILLNENKLKGQLIELENKGREIEEKRAQIAEKEETIKSQDRQLIFTYSFAIVVSLFSLLVVILFVKNRKTTIRLKRTLSDLEKTQKQLIQSEKMASLGQLTAGVAHEINTPLGIIVTSVSFIADKCKDLTSQINNNELTKSSLLTMIEKIQQALEMANASLLRTTDLVTNFKQVAVDHAVEELREINLMSYINEIVRSLSTEIAKNNVDCSLQGSSEAMINTYPGAIAQIITNLITNSLRHAFVDIEERKITIEISHNEDKGGVSIIYSDNGAGMDNEVLKKIYDPFFTTKRNQGGTGLGMNIVFNLVNDKLKGEIAVESEVNEGSKFVILLPNSIDNVHELPIAS